MDRVTYDAVTTYRRTDNYAYRTEALYGPDLKALLTQRVRVGSACQVIEKHGDSHWTDAVFVGSELVDPELGMLRYVVTIDGREHKVSADRIRPKGN